MQGFSRLNIEAENARKRLDLESQKAEEAYSRKMELNIASAFPEHLLTEKWRKKRLTQQKKSFDFFRTTYFPPEVHSQGWFKPGKLQNDIPKIMQMPGMQIILGPRGYAKTVTAMIEFIWEILNGELPFSGTYSETLDKAKTLMHGIANIIISNPRINADWTIAIESHNDNEFRFRVKGQKKPVVLKPYSPERSVRGAMQVFDRVKKLLGDDIETQSSPLAEDSVEHRCRRLEEAFKSLEEGGTFVIIGNNFSEECALNKYLIRQDEHKLEGGKKVHVYPAWSDETGPLWPERYKAKTADELQELHQAGPEEWSGDYQQRPERAGGNIFPEEFWYEYDKLPSDAVGIGYCDPNLALKTETSDFTVIGAFLYSPSENLYYAWKIRCKPMDNPEELLEAFFKINDRKIIALLAFDGNVNQEANWTNFVLLYCRKNKIPYPHIEYQRISVDLQSKTVASVYRQGRFRFPSTYEFPKEGEKFKKQIINFKGKKRKARNQKVDAADWLICSYTVLHDPEHYFGEGYAKAAEIKTFKDSFNF